MQCGCTGPSICPLKAIIGQLGGSLYGDYLFKGPFQGREVRVEDAQLSPRAVAGFPVLGSKASVLTNTPQLHPGPARGAKIWGCTII